MNKKITLYELLGLIKDGKAPRKVKGRLGKIYTYHNYCKDYIDDKGKLLFANLCQLIDKCLDDEVEILDDEDKNSFTGWKMYQNGKEVASMNCSYDEDIEIEEMKYYATNRVKNEFAIDYIENGETKHFCLNKKQRFIVDKINELVREINKLKKDK